MFTVYPVPEKGLEVLTSRPDPQTCGTLQYCTGTIRTSSASSVPPTVLVHCEDEGAVFGMLGFAQWKN